MPVRSPLWPAKLDHIRLDSADPAALARFYGETLGFAARRCPMTPPPWKRPVARS